jgi:hypothetical protein
MLDYVIAEKSTTFMNVLLPQYSIWKLPTFWKILSLG